MQGTKAETAYRGGRQLSPDATDCQPPGVWQRWPQPGRPRRNLTIEFDRKTHMYKCSYGCHENPTHLVSHVRFSRHDPRRSALPMHVCTRQTGWMGVLDAKTKLGSLVSWAHPRLTMARRRFASRSSRARGRRRHRYREAPRGQALRSTRARRSAGARLHGRPIG